MANKKTTTKKAAPAKAKKATKSAAKKTPSTKTQGKARTSAKTKAVRLLSGGNPQIAKGEGDGPVQAYIAAMPEWKQAIGRTVDAIITRSVPGVRKAVKWNSPMYGVEANGFFLGLHVFDNYVKVAFFQGAKLKPLPPGESKQKDVRYLDIRKDGFDEAQFALWVKQAAAIPGWKT